MTFLKLVRSLLFMFVCLSSGVAVSNDTDCASPDWDSVNTTNVTELTELFQTCLDERLEHEDCPDPSVCVETEPSSENLGLAFGLTIGAGLATGVGALLPFIPCIKRSDTKFLTASLGLAAGVMIYISFTEIFNEARIHFCCVSIKHYDLLTTSSFFIGIIITVLLDVLIHVLDKIDCKCGSIYRTCTCRLGMSDCCTCARRNSVEGTASTHLDRNTSQVPLQSMSSSNGELMNGNGHTFNRDNEGGVIVPHPPLDSCSNHSPNLPSVVDFSIPDNDRHTPSGERASISAASNAISTTTNNLGDASIQDLLSNTSIHRMHAVVADSVSNTEAISQSHVSISLMEDGFSLRTQSIPNGDAHSRISAPSMQRRASDEDLPEQAQEEGDGGEEGMEQFRQVTDVVQSSSKRLRKMGMLTGMAIAVHNFPEGFATFVGTLSDPSLGIALAIAIALHNIPEGVCVAMPVYYSTGSKLKALLWAFLSGVSEPIGAVIGWLTFRTLFGPLFYGIAFGIIAGMMVYVGLKELLPMAHKFDTTNGVLTNVFLMIGMVIMAVSLILFLY